MKIGYARISTDEQNLSLQVDALEACGCSEIFTDEGISGAINPDKRKGFSAAMEILSSGDTFVVWKLDRLGRSLGALINLMGEFEDQNINFISLTDGIDTTTAGGKLVFHIMGALAEFERSLISERTKAGMQSAKQRGKSIGRPTALTYQQIQHAAKLVEQGETISSVAELFDVSRNTLSRALSRKLTSRP